MISSLIKTLPHHVDILLATVTVVKFKQNESTHASLRHHFSLAVEATSDFPALPLLVESLQAMLEMFLPLSLPLTSFFPYLCLFSFLPPCLFLPVPSSLPSSPSFFQASSSLLLSFLPSSFSLPPFPFPSQQGDKRLLLGREWNKRVHE